MPACTARGVSKEGERNSMRLLICAQTVDRNDPSLGFFHKWIEELSVRFEKIDVVCLFEGEHMFSSNVTVRSLGKEKGPVSRLAYAVRFIGLIDEYAYSYDAVFVHQGQEFVLVGGMFWKAFGKPVYLWRNHYSGSFLTRVAAFFCTKVFYTSDSSYTARFKNAVKMPVGVDLATFEQGTIQRKSQSILSLGRIAPSKRIHLLIQALREVKEKGLTFTASIIGPTRSEDTDYHTQLTEMVEKSRLSERVTFQGGVPHREAARLFASHDMFVNMSVSGMYDKTVLEAAAAGCLVLTSIEDFGADAGEEFYFAEGELVSKLERMLRASTEEKMAMKEKLKRVARAHGLSALSDRLQKEIR